MSDHVLTRARTRLFADYRGNAMLCALRGRNGPVQFMRKRYHQVGQVLGNVWTINVSSRTRKAFTVPIWIAT